MTLKLLAFAFHTAARLPVLAWREAVIARVDIYRFIERPRTVTAYIVFETWDVCSDRSPPPCGRFDRTFETLPKAVFERIRRGVIALDRVRRMRHVPRD